MIVYTRQTVAEGMTINAVMMTKTSGASVPRQGLGYRALRASGSSRGANPSTKEVMRPAGLEPATPGLGGPEIGYADAQHRPTGGDDERRITHRPVAIRGRVPRDSVACLVPSCARGGAGNGVRAD